MHPERKTGSGMGIRAPVPRTRTGCLTCRKRKVKCDELHPVCSRCHRLQRECRWSDNMQVVDQRRQHVGTSINSSILDGNPLSGQNFVIELPNIDRATVPYIHHFVTFCSRFLAYSNDNEGNPFQVELFPLASTSPALLNSMAALAAGHLTRSQKQHKLRALNYYALALKDLNATLSNPVIARSDATLGACLFLCIYEILHPETNSLWLGHLQGARDLIMYRGGPKSSHYLTRFFAFFDTSAALLSGAGPLIPGNYWLDTRSPQERQSQASWPFYDPERLMVEHFHTLMIFMAQIARLSTESMTQFGIENPSIICQKATQIRSSLLAWWDQCPPELRNQTNDWRRQPRPRKLTVAETLEEESLSSTKSCVDGCLIFLHQLQDPLGLLPQPQEVIDAVSDIFEIANEIPPGFGLEMGVYFGLFMAGVIIFNDKAAEDIIRRNLKAGGNSSIYHADRVIELLEILWKRQRQFGTKFDWRQVQKQVGLQVFIFV